MSPRGHFDRNAVSIVEKLPGRMWTTFSLLKCLRTHYGRRCESFSDQNVLYCRILHIKCHTPPDPAEAPSVLGIRHQFPLDSSAFPLFLFYETTTGCPHFQIRSGATVIDPMFTTSLNKAHFITKKRWKTLCIYMLQKPHYM